ncbi:MAG: phosphatase PAP2 family protein [Cypionkella sp.]
MPSSNRSIAALIAASALVLLIFGIWPQLDLATSAYFYRDGGFPVDKNALITRLRYLVWDASLVMPLLALILLVVTAVLRRRLVLAARGWGYILALFLLGPGILVNAVLKQYWGRARPYDVTAYGGTHDFSPAYQISDQCARNCSFVSGEGSGAMALALSLLLILYALRHRLQLWQLRLGQGATLLMLLFAGWQRIASGGHFLSDVLLSWLFVALVAAVLARLMRPAA